MNNSITILIIFAFFSCRQVASLNEKEKEEIIDEVHETLRNYYHDIRKSGLTAEFKYLDSSEQFFWVPPGYEGPIFYDSVVNTLKQNAGKYRSIDNIFDTLFIIPLSMELASYTGRINSIMIDSAGKEMHYKMLETGLFIRREEGWKLLNGQTSISH